MSENRPTRAQAEALLHEFTQGDALRKHGRAVEEAMRGYARWYGIDDDARRSGEPDRAAIDELINSVDYAGLPAGDVVMDRCWHVGKCEQAGELPYTRRFRGSWANGPLYFLGPLAVESLVRDYLAFPAETLGTTGLEDKLVGDLLGARSILLTVRDLSPHFGIASHHEPMAPAPPVVVDWRP